MVFLAYDGIDAGHRDEDATFDPIIAVAAGSPSDFRPIANASRGGPRARTGDGIPRNTP
ncbi:hypothetical protein [Embleya scabrispora]|uniref:hypothetical protein n=1 Tax=Embleya scabrispora TaxID=159449 RepID=UPI000367CCCD|nr:hypothetical protein [Embleya scabrispora]MYS80143.1 hypothetical protein [Streptomyces sp. SID5474]